MDRSAVFKKLNDMGSMPTPSSVALEIMRLCRDDDSSLIDIAEVVETDPALSAKLLQYANSAMVSPGIKIASIPKATIKLGIKAVMNLALGFSLLSHNKTGVCKEFDYETFWSRSLAKAIAARSICRFTGNMDPDEIFVCGLLSHIGSLALASLFPEDYSLLFSENLTHESMILSEREQFGIDHKQLSSELFLSWGLPEQFSTALILNGDESISTPETNSALEICNILKLSDSIADLCMFEMPLQDKVTKAERRAHLFGLDEPKFAEIFDTILESWQRWGHTFQVPIPNCPLYQQIKETVQIETTEREHPIKVLVVDDDPMTLLTLKHMLQKSGKKVYTANDGEAALALALEKQPDMVITDWKMPFISGIELCKILRNTGITQHIYIIMLTGRESEDELVQALDAGADEFVIKPFTPRVLEAKIQSGERIIQFQQMINRDREVIQKYAARLAAANRKLQAMAMTDALTSLPNRRSALKNLKKVVAEAQRHRESLACIMIDIDHFKQVNDNHGHDTGDQVLIKIAKIFKKTVRSYDSVSRLGGEEFLVICSRSTLEESQQLAERLRLAVENMYIDSKNKTIKTTISLGIAAWDNSMKNGEEMVRAADNALYRAKKMGRNKVMVDGEEMS